MLHENAVESNTLELLKKICKLDSLTDFGLAGGTSLALRFGHRLSIDLDFFISSNFRNSLVFQTITDEFPTATLLFEQNQTMMFSINGIKVDFILYPFEWLHPFDLIKKTRLVSVADIIPMKLQSLSNRFSKKDFWDIAFLLKVLTLEKMMELFRAKFPQVDPGFIIHSLTAFDEAEREPDPVCIMPKTWMEVQEDLKNEVIQYTNQFL